jgi:hypothetical protein
MASRHVVMTFPQRLRSLRFRGLTIRLFYLAYVDLYAIMAANQAHQLGVWSSPGLLCSYRKNTIQDGLFGFDDIDDSFASKPALESNQSPRGLAVYVWTTYISYR